MTATTEGMKKIGRSRKRWTDEVEEDGMEDFSGSQGSQRVVVFKKKNKLTKSNLTC